MAALRPVVAAGVAVEADDWQAAVRAACRLLVEAGAADQGYVDACVAMVEEHGPYMVVAPGIALAHARPEDGARMLGVSVAVLARPVEFGHPDNDPVDVVFAFGSPDADQHVELLASLAGGLTEGLADGLRAAPDDTAARDSLTRAIDGG
jgi:ascorbate PTS system EIIA or EIIAB component